MPTLDTDLARQVADRGSSHETATETTSSGADPDADRDPNLARLERLEYAARVGDPLKLDAQDDRRFNLDRFSDVNRDLWIILSLLAIAAVANQLLAAQRLVLGFYTFPTIYAAFYCGRRHATLTAAASALLVGLLSYIDPDFWSGRTMDFYNVRLYDLATWGLMLMLTAFYMGTLHERFLARSRELRKTYHGLLMILRQFINQDRNTADHSYRVSLYAVGIAKQMKLDHDRVELVRAAALLHDLGKNDTSRDVLYRAAEITEDEHRQMREHVRRGVESFEHSAVTMGRVLPIILAHHDRREGDDHQPITGEDVPLEARIIAVADVYDALACDRNGRRPMPPGEARETIRRGAGNDFDPEVVKAFLRAFDRGFLEVSEFYS